MSKNVVIVEACRTPFDKFGGALKDISSIELGKFVLEKVMERANLPKDIVGEVFYGSCMHAEFAQYQNIPARQAVLKAGFPSETLSCSVDRACCSSLYAVELAYQAIMNGDQEVCIACGAENMSNVPLLVPPSVRWGIKAQGVLMDDQLSPLGYERTGWTPVALDAGEVSVEYNVTREEQDAWALQSQQRYQEALKAGRWDTEIVPVEIPGKKETLVFSADASPRADVTMEALAKLKTVYNSPTITAGNAPGINTGASAVLIMSEEMALKLGKKPLAYIRSTASVADDYRYIPRVPATAIKKATEKIGKTYEDLALIEINEAFAAMPLISCKILADGDEGKKQHLHDITNVNGGAVALGHPVGASGARLVMTLMYELIRRGGGLGAAAICGGLAQGDCVVIEVPKQ